MGNNNLTLPDLAAPGTLLLLLLIGLIVSLFVTLIGLDQPARFWNDFGLHLLFVQWNVVASALAFAGVNRLLRRRSRQVTTLCSFLVVPAVVFCTSMVVVAFGLWSGPPSEIWFVTRNTLMAVIVSLMLVRYIFLQQQWRLNIAAESRFRLEALQARIHPHFLFNALNTISELIHSRPSLAEEALLDLSDLLRTGLRSEARHTLEEEFELVRGYLRIEGLRLGERLAVEWSLDEAVDRTIEIPALLIQPLVENAVLHGIASLPDGGRLSIRLEPARFARARIIVENPLPSPDQPRRQGNRTALENIRQRLALAYEEGASLKTERAGAMFRAVLTLPLKTAH